MAPLTSNRPSTACRSSKGIPGDGRLPRSLTAGMLTDLAKRLPLACIPGYALAARTTSTSVAVLCATTVTSMTQAAVAHSEFVESAAAGADIARQITAGLGDDRP